VAAIAVGGVATAMVLRPAEQVARHAAGYAKKIRPHFDHAAVITRSSSGRRT